jgi:hypothetical protein
VVRDLKAENNNRLPYLKEVWERFNALSLVDRAESTIDMRCTKMRLEIAGKDRNDI